MTTRIPISAGTKSYLYDNCGRTTEEKWNGTTVKTYAWNHDDRLVSATGSWGTRSYGYNGLGSRVSETGGQGRSWLRRGPSVTSTVIRDGINRYSTGGTFRPLAGGTSTFMGGGHKSVDALLSSSQTVTGSVRSDAFGLTKEQTGTWNQPFGFGGNFGYQTDDDTGLELLGNRYYDASTGRFLSKDPIKDGPNWYAYCLNDPVNQADPARTMMLAALALMHNTRGLIAVGKVNFFEFSISIAVAKYKRRLLLEGFTDVRYVREPSEKRLIELPSDPSTGGFVYIGHGINDSQRAKDKLHWSSPLGDDHDEDGPYDTVLDDTTIGKIRK